MFFEFERKKDFYDYLKQNAKVEEINVNNHLVLTIRQMMRQIQPYCAYLEFDDESAEKKGEIFEKLKNNYKFYEIDINQIIEHAKIRKIIENDTQLSLEEKINLIRPLLFREECSKVILNTFPCNMDECNAFESQLCQISKYIVVTDKKFLNNINISSIIANHLKRFII